MENSILNKFPLGWGDSFCVRKSFIEASDNFYIPFNNQDIIEMGYTPHEGDPAMIEATRKIVERQTGINYNHIVLTHGATGALNVALTALKNSVFDNECVITTPPPFFRMYPEIISNSGFIHTYSEDLSNFNGHIILIDSPSNPTGKLRKEDFTNLGKNAIIFDSVYHTPSYMGKGYHAPPKHLINVGSYSKMTGINGIRIGWAATNDTLIYERLKKAVSAEYCGLSAAQNRIALDLVTHVDWDLFEMKARNKLDANREEWSKLEKYFGDKAVYPVGMFYYAPADAACRALLDKAGVTYFGGEQLHHTNEYLRINLGQDVELVRDAVKAILAEDKI